MKQDKNTTVSCKYSLEEKKFSLISKYNAAAPFLLIAASIITFSFYETNRRLREKVMESQKEVIGSQKEVIQSLETNRVLLKENIKQKEEIIGSLEKNLKKDDEFIESLEARGVLLKEKVKLKDDYIRALEEDCRTIPRDYTGLLEQIIPVYADQSKNSNLDIKELNDLLGWMQCKKLPSNYRGELIPDIFVTDDIDKCSYKIENLDGSAKLKHRARQAIISIKIPLKDADAYVKAHRRM